MLDKKSSKSSASKSELAAARKRGDKRTADVRKRVFAAMSVIEVEMNANNDIYPHRNGSLSIAEVARRANIHPTSFYTEKLKGLGAEVKIWLNKIKNQKLVGSGKVKKTLTARVGEWKKLYDGLLQSHHVSELELQQAQADLLDSKNKIIELEKDIARLNAIVVDLKRNNIVAMPKKKNG
ncbi:UNVERIFIED_ORG: hypothetical protein HNP28_003220 [Comamonas terrigena]